MNALLTWGDYVSNIRLDASQPRFGSEALEDLLEHVPVAIAVTVGPGHRIVFANRTFRDALQKSHDDPRGKTIAEVRGEDYSPELETIRQRVLETGEGAELPAHPVASSGVREVTYWDVKFLPVRDAKDRVVGILTLGLEVTSLVQAQEEAAQNLREAEYHNARLALAVEATALGLWEWDAQTGRTYWSPRQREIFGLPSGQEPSYEFWLSALHPEDRDRVIHTVSGLMDPHSGGQLELEHRLVHPTGEVRWVLSRGRMTYEDVDGHLAAARLLGTVLDITSRKHAEEERQLLLRETNHRVLNLFALTNSMIGMTARSSRSPSEMAERLSGRIEALARAHELIRPALVGEGLAQPPTSLHDLIAIVLAPHADIAGQRLLTGGPDVPVGSKAATALTLVFHELATNAAKYGALSVDGGQVEITWHLEGDHVHVHWCESGGPAVTSTPRRQGFGTRLLRGSLNQLAGEITYEWAQSGLVCIIRLTRSDMMR